MYLIFDTETTGLPKNWSAPAEDFDNWPRIVQLCFGLYEEDGKEISFNNFIIKPEGFVIPDEAAIIHGITTERALKEGLNLNFALVMLAASSFVASHHVAHNIGFDKKIVCAEIERLRNSGVEEAFFMEREEIDTMIYGTDLCKIAGPKGGFKWPKLNELHQFLFNEAFDGAHDAMNDVRACARCFFEMKKRGIIDI